MKSQLKTHLYKPIVVNRKVIQDVCYFIFSHGKLFFYLMLFFNSSNPFAQNKNIDSLLKASEKFVYREFDAKLDPLIIFELIAIQPQIKEVNKHALSNFYIAHYYYSIFDDKNAEKYYKQALNEFQETKNWGQYVNVIKDLVSTYRREGKKEEIKNLLFESIAISKQENVGYHILNTLHELIMYYSYDVNEPEEAIKYGALFFDRLSFYDKLNISSSEFIYTKTVDANIAYLEIGHSHLRLKDYKKAKYYLDLAEKFFNEYNDSEKLSRIYSHLLSWSILTNQPKGITFNYLNRLKTNIQDQNETELKRFKIAVNETTNLYEIKKNLVATQIENKRLLKYNIILAVCIILIIIIVIFIIIIVYKYYKIQKDTTESLANKNILLEKIDEERNNYLSIISHELKTPVFTISGLSSLLKEDNYDYQSITMIKETSDYLLHLIKNILLLPDLKNDPSRLKNTKKDTFNVISLIENIINNYQFIAKQKNITIIHECNDPLFNQNIISYKHKISQIVINLLLNAIKFSPMGETIKIITHITKLDDEKTILLDFHIQDNGDGIDPLLHAKIFEYKNNIEPQIAESDNDLKGLGVGLYVVSQLLKTLNSEIILTSELGKGSTFSFALRLEIDLGHNGKIATYEVVTPLNILAVDDNKLNLLVTKKITEKLGFRAFTCTDQDDVLAIIEERAIDLVLMDINMPNINGYDLSKKIKAKKDIIIIAHTAGNNVTMDAPKTIDAKIDEVIAKPYKEDELIHKIYTFFPKNFKPIIN